MIIILIIIIIIIITIIIIIIIIVIIIIIIIIIILIMIMVMMLDAQLSEILYFASYEAEQFSPTLFLFNRKYFIRISRLKLAKFKKNLAINPEA